MMTDDACYDHQRSVAMRRRDERGPIPPFQVRGHHEPALGDLRRGMLADIANLFQRGEVFAG